MITMLERLLLVCVACGLATSGAQAQSELLRTFQTVDNIKANGYPAETHHVTTPDGYILEMHRIPNGRSTKNDENKKPVVFLMHGLMGASNGFIFLGVNYSFAYNLADEGFDVWMGNARGNYHSRAHISLDPDDPIQKFEFFDFTYEEIGLYDLPAMIDYALEHTGNKQLQYIGHSQGGTSFMVLTSMKPEYNNKIASAHLLAGVGYQEYFPNEMLADLAYYADFYYEFGLVNGIVELYPELIAQFPRSRYRTSDYCTGNLEQRHFCELIGIKYILGRDSIDDQDELVPAGASLKQAAHYGQNIRDKLFRRYHHGPENNTVIYGSEEPPLYNLSLITCNVTMHYSMNDTLLDERDVLAMVADMPNARSRRVARESFDHTDYITSLDAKEMIIDHIIAALKYVSSSGSATGGPLNVYLALFSLILIIMNYRNI